MADVKAQIACSLTMVVTGDDVNNGLFEPKTLHENIRKTLGGSGETTVTAASAAATVTGFTNGVPTYIEADSSGVTIGITGAGTDYCVHVKHTGHEFSTSAVLGDSTTDTMDVILTDTDGSTALFTITLAAGQAIQFPDVLIAASCKILVKRGGSTNLAAEIMFCEIT